MIDYRIFHQIRIVNKRKVFYETKIRSIFGLFCNGCGRILNFVVLNSKPSLVYVKRNPNLQ